MSANLDLLASKLGIATSFTDAGLTQKTYTVCPDVVRTFALALGYPCANDDEVAASLSKLDERRWQEALQPIYVCRQDNVKIDIVLPRGQHLDALIVKDSRRQIQTVRLEEYQEPISYRLADKTLVKYAYAFTTPLDIGYYDLCARVGAKNYKSRLAVAPERCFEAAGNEQRLWGYAVQLYSVKSKRNWGVGDFTDLAELVKMCARCGASIIGLNPLNVLCHDFPENASPYQSISRLFLNPIYIDVESVPEFADKDKQLIEGVLAEVRSSELIQYNKVYPLKVKMLEKCFKRFLEGGNSARRHAFDKFCSERGQDLDKLALFQTLYEAECQKVWGGWMAWPEEYHSPSGSGILDFADTHRQRIEFFKFMQFEADRQFGAVKNLVDELGLKIGLYRDLAVGVGKDSAEYWGNADLFIPGVGAGAPPDAFFPCGQSWGLGAFSPEKLKDLGYEPFIKILRANMQGAGALRIDHVMSLMRLYMIPDNQSNGTYVYYNFADMLNIVALESQLNRCIIVGESIGNVPDGFLDTLQSRNIHSLSVLWAERANAGWGGFLAPYDYPANAFTSVGTHDMPPLKMWWFGYDIEESFKLGMISSEADKANAYHKREADRGMLLSSLDAAGVWPEDRPRSGNYIYGEKYPEGIEEAVHRYIARSASPVVLVQLEDFLHVEKQQNLPGTDRDKHPNWRLKLPVNLEDMETDPAYIRNVMAIRKER